MADGDSGTRLVSFARRLSNLAERAPDMPAVTDEDRSLTRAELDDLATRTARAFAGYGAGSGSMVTIALPNSVEFVAAVIACWKIGATPQPVSFMAPHREVSAIVDLADPVVVVGAEPQEFEGRVCLPRGWEPGPEADTGDALADAISEPWKAMTSGGSTGSPKLILVGEAGRIDAEFVSPFAIANDGCHMMPGPLYHNGPFVWSTHALLAGAHLVLGGRFDAERTLGLIERYRADSMYIVPTMMGRIWKLPEEVRERYDVSSLRVVWHLSAPCPPWLKDAWIGWLGPEKIFELYAGTEAQAATIISGTEWLEHRGSVGRPIAGEMKIVGDGGEDLPPGEVGEVFMRPSDPDRKTYRYVGAEARTIDEGWESLGDLGWMDADGYLYLSDRKKDMILVGGSNVYPAEVEAAIEEHPLVQSSVVIGLPDDDLGSRVHALVHASGALDVDDLRVHLADRLVRYKIPRTFEMVDEPLRDDAGKVRRSALAQERGAGEHSSRLSE